MAFRLSDFLTDQFAAVFPEMVEMLKMGKGQNSQTIKFHQ